jgi:methylated-DNA-protein-cysteine methyltransferase-like protein
MKSRQLTVYIRRHCHLCEQMIQALESWRLGYGLNLQLLDVDEDPVLAARFGERVPVLADGEQILAEFFLDEAKLRSWLDLDEPQASLREAGVYERIYAIVRQVPSGKVATYGQIAKVEGHATARMVGYAMAALSSANDVPWQRVINARGEISERSGGGGTSSQRERLDSEGVFFNARGRVDFARAGWSGPDAMWCATHGFYVLPDDAMPPGQRARSSESSSALRDTQGKQRRLL